MRDDHLAPILSHPATRELARRLEDGAVTSALGSAGSSATLCALAAAQLAQRPLILVTPHLDDADEAVEEVTALGFVAAKLPALEVLPGESAASLDLFAQRLSVVQQVRRGELLSRLDDATSPTVLVAPIQALMQRIPGPDRVAELVLTLTPGDERGPEAIVRWLGEAGYKRLDSIEEPGDFAVRGGIVDVFPTNADVDSGAVRLDFFGDELESINEIDLATMGSDRRVDSVDVVASLETERMISDDDAEVLELLPERCLAIIAETLEATEQGRGYYERVTDARGIVGPPAVFKRLRERFHACAEINQFAPTLDAENPVTLPARPLPEFSRTLSEAVEELASLHADAPAHVLCQNEGEAKRFAELAAEFAPDAGLSGAARYLHRGFVWGFDDDEHRAALVPYAELLHRYQTRRRIRKLRGSRTSDTFLELTIGDYVVHQDHGVAKFIGIKSMTPKRASDTLAGETKRSKKSSEETAEEYLTLEFARRSKLHVPVTQIDKVQKYVGGFAGKPPLSALGGKKWQNQKESAKESVRDMAAELLRVQAAREHAPGVRFPEDTEWQREFEAEFPFEETEDQLAALAEIKKDMARSRPMDRLLCGDVGYGKTELAVRAAFKAVEYGRQVAVLVPTTILAEQHERTFRSRFADYPFTVASVSRFKSRKAQNETLAKLRKGQVDVIIGTHRLLSNDVKFADLGLVVVDEEQRFGVEHKNALLKLRVDADVLTLSATPIPRTLHMSMLGLRDISSLSTPPLDRRAVVTEVLPYNEVRIKRAIERELAREGQVYVVNNRVHNIRSVADDVRRMVPDARILVGHGQMPTQELEEVMSKFIRREADVLVATTIIESGIDIPTANTMIILSADHFGLAELHQLRGRVGRYKHRAYCYMCLPGDRPVNDVARRRLKAIEEYSMLGAGFKIAMRDLEIRGAGNLLGAEQSGHIAAIGYDLYCKLLEQAAREMRNESTSVPSDTTVDLGLPGSIPKPYIPSDTRRLEAYRRIADARTLDQLESARQDLEQAYGDSPPATSRLFDLAELRIGAHELGVRAIAIQDRDVIFRAPDTGALLERMEGIAGTVRPLTKPTPEGAYEVYYRPPDNYRDPHTLLTVLRRRLAQGQESVEDSASSESRGEPAAAR